jgi:tetratricopeptide (TPR) repeat protein
LPLLRLQVAKSLPDQAKREQYEFELELALGPALIAAKGYTAPETIDSYARARELAARMNQPLQLISVLHGQWMQALMRNEMPLARQLSKELLDLGEARDDVYWKWQGCESCGVTCFPAGDFVAARNYLERAVVLYRDARDTVRPKAIVDEGQFLRLLNLDEGHVVVLAYLSWVLMYLGFLDQARARGGEALEEARRCGQAYPVTHALNGAAYVALTLGDYMGALRHLDDLDAVIEEHGIAYYRPMSRIWRGWCTAALGDSHGLQQLTSGLAAYRQAGTHVYVTAFLRFLADAYRRVGQPRDGLLELDEAAHLMQISGAHGDEAEMHRVRGETLLDLDDEQGAEASLRTAVEVARRRDAKLCELRASIDLARLWQRQGRRAEAYDLLASICSWFQGGGLAELEDARALLKVLHGPSPLIIDAIGDTRALEC